LGAPESVLYATIETEKPTAKKIESTAKKVDDSNIKPIE
jgi:hypothetical protein